MRITHANMQAIKYACTHFHYSKRTPVNPLGYNVYNDNDEWCGVVLYGYGANMNYAKQFGLAQGEVMELLRVALNGKQTTTSQVVAYTMKQLKKDCPLVKILVSYADEEQGHKGIIYQAMNWVYIGDIYKQHYVHKLTGKFIHNRAYCNMNASQKAQCEKKSVLAKHKYIYPLNHKYKSLCESLKKDKLFMRQ